MLAFFPPLLPVALFNVRHYPWLCGASTAVIEVHQGGQLFSVSPPSLPLSPSSFPLVDEPHILIPSTTTESGDTFLSASHEPATPYGFTTRKPFALVLLLLLCALLPFRFVATRLANAKRLEREPLTLEEEVVESLPCLSIINPLEQEVAPEKAPAEPPTRLGNFKPLEREPVVSEQEPTKPRVRKSARFDFDATMVCSIALPPMPPKGIHRHDTISSPNLKFP